MNFITIPAKVKRIRFLCYNERMLGVILASIGSFFGEISDSIGKKKVADHKESRFTMGFLSVFWSLIFFALIGLAKRDGFVFSLDSLPTFSARAILEIIQLYVSVVAIVEADRSTFGFVRTITLPLLLVVDFVLGYKIGFFPVIGIVVIIAALSLIFLSKGVRKKGIGFIVFSAVNAVATISLFKYDITHFNSVSAEQFFIYLILLFCFSLLAVFRAKENPFVFLTKPVFFLQSASTGIGGVIESFSYNFGAASVITAAKRSSAIFWSFLSGRMYFKEKNFLLKFFILLLVVAGLILLSLP